MLAAAIVAIFVIAYAAIALEHPIRINKSATALLGAGLLWTVYAIFGGDTALVEKQLNELVASTAQIIFFLIGAMTIVEVIDAHNGFEVITSLIRTRKQVTPDVADRLRDVLPQRHAGQSDDDHRHDLADAEAARQAERPPVLRGHDRDRGQRRRRLVGDR